MHTTKRAFFFLPGGGTYAQLRCTKEVIFRQFVFAGDSVALAVEG